MKVTEVKVRHIHFSFGIGFPQSSGGGYGGCYPSSCDSSELIPFVVGGLLFVVSLFCLLAYLANEGAL